MPENSQDSPYYKRRILSFKYAFEGITAALKKEPNLKIHFSVALLVLLIASILRITSTDFVLIVMLISLVISIELTNTAIESVIDSFTDKEHPIAKYAKDISAGAVLVVAFSAAVCGILIFSKYL